MMQDMMKRCCTEDGMPDFEKMMKFMQQSCGKEGFSEDEMAIMKQFCGEAGMPDPEKMKQMMERCGCHVS